MSAFKLTREVARWEFRRYLKPKQQVVGAVTTLGLMLGGVFIAGLVRDEPATVELAVVGAELLDLPAELGRFRIERSDESALEELRRDVEQRDRDAVLILHGDGAGDLVARQTPAWHADLGSQLSALATRRRLGDSGLDMERLAAIQAPFQLDAQEIAPRAGRGERVAAFIALGLTLMGLFTGMGYIFISVTGDKQNRLSEQIVSAVPAQAWIDGKIVGLAVVSVVSMLSLVVPGLVLLGLNRVFWGWSLPLPTSVERPDLLLPALGLISLGFLFWCAFIAAVAALVDDPHTSSPQPAHVPADARYGARVPRHRQSRRRMDPRAVHRPAHIRRRAAGSPPRRRRALVGSRTGRGFSARRDRPHPPSRGKVFRLGMLMYGKEPTWGEVRRWLREA